MKCINEPPLFGGMEDYKNKRFVMQNSAVVAA